MVSKIGFAVIFIFVQVWTATAAPKAKAAAATATTAASIPSFDEFVSQAQAAVKAASEHLNEMVGLPKNADAGHVFDAIKNSTEKLTKDISQVAEKIKKEIDSAKTSEVSETVKSIQEKLEKTAESLKKEIESPEAKAKTKQIQENFTKSLNVIVEEASKLSKTMISDKTLSEDFQKLSKQVVDQAVEAADHLQKSIHDATGHKAESGHKH